MGASVPLVQGAERASISIFGVKQRFSAAIKAGACKASAAEVPQRLKPLARQQLYGGLKACSAAAGSTLCPVPLPQLPYPAVPTYIGSIDQGTTSTRFCVFDLSGKIVASAQKEHEQI